MSDSLGLLSFAPFLRPMPWGGCRLAGWLDRADFPQVPIGEAWLLSDHPLHRSVITSPPLAGQTISQVVQQHPQALLGRAAERFPLLVKLLDAKENLSIQVHPDDEAALRWARNEGGKTEAWLVLAAQPGSCIYHGLKAGVDREMFARELSRGTPHLALNRFEPRAGECYFVPAGTVHALGGGVVVLEVQQTSDATFRLHDWGRVDSQGRPRELHLEAGLACVRPELPGGPSPPGVLAQGHERLAACPYFTFDRLRLPAGSAAMLAPPSILFVIEGSAVVAAAGQSAELVRGGLLFIPAAFSSVRLEARSDCVLASVGM